MYKLKFKVQRFRPSDYVIAQNYIIWQENTGEIVKQNLDNLQEEIISDNFENQISRIIELENSYCFIGIDSRVHFTKKKPNSLSILLKYKTSLILHDKRYIQIIKPVENNIHETINGLVDIKKGTFVWLEEQNAQVRLIVGDNAIVVRRNYSNNEQAWAIINRIASYDTNTGKKKWEYFMNNLGSNHQTLTVDGAEDTRFAKILGAINQNFLFTIWSTAGVELIIMNADNGGN